MKIISWNCNGALRNKIQVLLNEDADIYLFQECEHFSKWQHLIDDFHQPFFVGENKNKGIAIIAKKHLKCEILDWETLFYQKMYDEIEDKSMRYFLPILVNNSIKIVNCWCHKNNSQHFAYKGQLWKYLIANKNNIDINTIFMGDFNANKVWDDKDCWWNMSNNNKILNSYGLISAYHKIFNEELGTETQKTFYLYRHYDKGYYIDYAYANIDKILNFKIFNKEEYSKLSDHLPIFLEV